MTENKPVIAEKRDVSFDEAFVWIILLTLVAVFSRDISKFMFPGLAQMILALVAAFVFLFTKGSAKKFGFTFSRKALKWLGTFILIFGAFYGIILLVMILTKQTALANADYSGLETILSYMIFAPIAEEILFRGFLFRALQRNFKFWFALIVSAALFAVMHMVWGNVGLQNINHFIGGIVFALIYVKTRSIFASMILHSLGNSALIILSLIL